MNEIQTPTQQDCSQLVIDLQKEIKKLSDFLENKSFNKKDDVRYFAILYAGQVLDFSNALVILQGKNAVGSQFTIWRSLFEAYARFCFLIDGVQSGENPYGDQLACLNDLLLEAYIDEEKYLNDEECALPDSIKTSELSRVEKEIDRLKKAGATKKSFQKYLQQLAERNAIFKGDTFGWYPKFRIFSGLAHSRITTLQKIYAPKGCALNFPIQQSTTFCAFMFGEAQRFLVGVGSGITLLWDVEEIRREVNQSAD
ncbi:DUF5677 domain-containing protein [Limnohabitans sp.]|uniref:DUF5677 domain-containing protein n=1 Tax=Limnohabitans sp. TaxID=1907725 RepID=UPI0025C41501|nr:DUF5677 domain-containing protein [Limnohabitans sp.]